MNTRTSLEDGEVIRMVGFEMYQDKRKGWRWRLRAHNGRIVADSSEGYVSKRSCIKGMDIVSDLVFEFMGCAHKEVKK